MAVAAKAQHEPHACWSFTGDTEPWTNQNEDQGHVTDIHQSQPTLSLQSTDSGSWWARFAGAEAAFLAAAGAWPGVRL